MQSARGDTRRVITPPDWRRALLLTHRWMGIVGGLLVVAWFASGIVMMYARMPELDVSERLARAPALDLGALAVSPSQAGRIAGASEQALLGARIGMLGARPIYRFGAGVDAGAVYADTGRRLSPFTPETALSAVANWYPEHAEALRHDDHLTEPDQWTLQSRAELPLHRIALGDAKGTRVYLSDRTGDLVMETTASERRWAYAGAVLHWLYFAPFRAHAALWAQTIICLSIAGCGLTLSGLLWGIVRFRGGSPYSGLLRWHHYAGLAFGLFTFTWMLSGGLSMDPWSWHPGTAPTAAQREGVAGGPLRADAITVEHVRAAGGALAAPSPGESRGAATVREIGLVQLDGAPYFLGYDGSAPPRLVSALPPGGHAFVRFSDDEMLEAARAAMPGVPITDATWLTEHDAYYYGRGSATGDGPPLPVLRVRYANPQETWLYLDPARGQIVRKEERLTRLNRWLYRGLHSLDFPGLYARRPLWDVVVIVLSLGGLTVAGTTLLPGWRRVARILRRGAASRAAGPEPTLSAATPPARSPDRSSRPGTSR